MKNIHKRLQNSSRFHKEHIPSVADYMSKDVISFKAETDISHVIDVLLNKGITGAPILNDLGEVVGLIDDKDCMSVLFGNMYNQLPEEHDTVSKYMSNVMRHISADDTIMDAAYIFASSPYKRLLVMDASNNLVGLISRSDVLKAIKAM